jgi:hypothetical protein
MSVAPEKLSMAFIPLKTWPLFGVHGSVGGPSNERPRARGICH